MNRRRSLAAAASGVLLSASLVFTGGSANATVVVSRPGRPVADPDGPTANGVVVIAHRGASARGPENTLPAMRAGVSAGAGLVEFDVQRTSDQRLIVVHDTSFARNTDVASVFPGRANDPVGSFTLDEVERLNAGSWRGSRFAGTRVPTLSALLRTMRPTRTGLLLELKNPTLYPGYASQIAHALRRWGFTGDRRVWVHSFDAIALADFHRASPTAPVGLITETGDLPQADTAWLSSVNTTTSNVTDSRVDSALANDLATLAWPNGPHDDDQRQMERLLDDGVGGIITDHPAEAHALLRSQGYVSSSPSGITEWMPATASTIDGTGGSRALAGRLSVEYAGAVPAVEVTKLVRHVVRDLGRRRVAPARLLDVADARCRRELTDLIARGDRQSS